MREAASPFFSTKIYGYIWDTNIWNLNETLANKIISFEQPEPDKPGAGSKHR